MDREVIMNVLKSPIKTSSLLKFANLLSRTARLIREAVDKQDSRLLEQSFECLDEAGSALLEGDL